MQASSVIGGSGSRLGAVIAILAVCACAETAVVDSAAYPLYLEGVALYGQGGESNLRQSIEKFREAGEADSTFAPAFAGLARAYAAIGGNYNILSPEESWPEAKEAAARALQLDEGLPEAHLAQAVVKYGADWDWAGAELEFQRALELDPDNVEALSGYAWFLYGLGRQEEAATFAARASELAPGSADPFLLYATTGDAAGQIAAVNATIDADPGNPQGYWVAALIHTWEGEYEQAAERLQQQIPLMDGDVVDEVALLGFVYGRMGREEDARNMLTRLDGVAAEGRYVSPVLRAWIHSGLGEADAAMAFLREGYEARAHRSGLGMNSFSAVFDPIRDRPEFNALYQEMGLQPLVNR
jgi:adenylate cyclase